MCATSVVMIHRLIKNSSQVSVVRHHYEPALRARLGIVAPAHPWLDSIFLCPSPGEERASPESSFVAYQKSEGRLRTRSGKGQRWWQSYSRSDSHPGSD